MIDPVAEEPNEYIGFSKAQILSKTERGQKTIGHIKLDRVDLSQARAWWLLNIEILLLLVLYLPKVKTEARELLLWAMQPDAPYTAMTRAYLRNIVPKLANPATPHPIINPAHPLEHITRLVERHRAQLQTFI